MDGLLAEVLRDFRPGVVRTELLLVDVLLENIAEHIGVDLVGLSAGSVIQVPGIYLEQSENR